MRCYPAGLDVDHWQRIQLNNLKLQIPDPTLKGALSDSPCKVLATEASSSLLLALGPQVSPCLSSLHKANQRQGTG